MKIETQPYHLNAHLDRYWMPRELRTEIHDTANNVALFMERDLARATLDSIGDAVLSTDTVGNVTYLNAIAEKMTGWSRKAAMGRPFSEVFQVVDGSTRQPPDRNPIEFTADQKSVVGLAANSVLVRRDGFEYDIEDSIAPIRSQDGRVIGVVMVFRDVSAARAVVLNMSHLAQHDFLTGLPNPMLLDDRIKQVIAQAERNQRLFALLFIDLDRFKRVNDSLGHDIGDKLLQSAAACITRCVRGSDTVSRKGGDEFVVLLSEVVCAEDAAYSAGKIIAALSTAHQCGGHELRITASVGISLYARDGKDAETLLKCADAAMYHAKMSGRNQYRFYKEQMSRTAGQWPLSSQSPGRPQIDLAPARGGSGQSPSRGHS